MKIIIRTFITILILIIIALIFRGWLYRHLINYKSIGLRTNYSVKDKKLADLIETSIDKQTEPEIKQIIKLGLSITSTQLNFTSSKNDIDPNKLVNSKAAHCVGYAAFFATSCNYLLKKYNLADSWAAKPQIGKLYFLGINVHNYFNSRFFKDHDFVIIENKRTGEIFAVDPTINDYLYIDFITYTK